jgi:glutamate-1-semialdehyde 2,1-aminomutase
VPARVPVCGPLVGLVLSERDVTDYDTARAAVGEGRYPSFFTAMLRRGVALAPGPYEVLFPGMAHTDAVLDTVVEAAAEAALVTSPGRR